MRHICQELTLNPVQFLHFLNGLLRDFIGIRVFNGDRNLVRQCGKEGDIVFGESI